MSEHERNYGFIDVRASGRTITLTSDDMPWTNASHEVHLASARLQTGQVVFVGSAIRDPELIEATNTIPNLEIANKQLYTGIQRVIQNERGLHTLPAEGTPHTIFFPAAADEQGSKRRGEGPNTTTTYFMRLNTDPNTFIKIAAGRGAKVNQRIVHRLTRR